MKGHHYVCLNAPYGARCFLTHGIRWAVPRRMSLNAPYGARCFLTGYPVDIVVNDCIRLNAPYGARCFLTLPTQSPRMSSRSLNAPYGARCFLTDRNGIPHAAYDSVLMHLMALGAF